MAAEGEVLRSAQLGVRVRRGPDWKWDDQDAGGAGTTKEGANAEGWVAVKWDAGGENNYRVGAQGEYDLMVARDPMPAVLRFAQSGLRVRRGPDWKWGDQDGGGPGTTLSGDDHDGCVWVKWDAGRRNKYRIGAEGSYDLIIDSAQPVEVLKSAQLGVRVKRGPDWRWQDQDGGGPGTTVPGADEDGWVRVRWDRATRANNYRVGAQGSHDLVIDFSPPTPTPSGSGEVLKSAHLGIRVRRGPDWDWGPQDHGGLGTTIQGDTEEGWVRVRWDLGGENSYRVGERGKYDLIVDATSPPYARPVPGEVLRTAEAGIRVRRGPDWDWGDQDGGGLGTTEADSDPGWVTVKWDHSGRTNSYRVGKEGNYDLIVAELESHIRVGDRVRFTQEAGDVSFSGCPGRTLAFSVGDTYVVREVREGWFTTRQWENLWAPLGAVEPDTAAEAASEPSSSGQRPAAAPAAAPSESLEAGHDEQWLDPAEATSMQCAICLSVARNALAHDCGNLFCELCWTRWVAENPSCPVCREAGDTIVKAPRDRRKILNLMVRCPLGCEETFRLGDKETHVSHCAKRAVTCCHCGEEVLADQISIHEKDRLKRRRFDVE